MSYTVEKLEKSQVKFNYVVNKDGFKEACKKAYEKTKGKYNIPGFRKGHAPQKVIEGMYGEEVFYSDALDTLVDESLYELEGLKEYDFVAVDTVKDVDFAENGDVKYSIVMIVKPEVKLGKYKDLGIAKKEAKVTAKEVDEAVEDARNKQARFIDSDKASKNGSTVTIDFVGSVDGVPFDGGAGNDYDLELGSGTFIPGFEDQLIGLKAGEQKDVKVTFPKEYGAENLAGKDAVFACTVKAVKEKELPKLDDDFAKEISEFDTLAEYKESVKKDLQEKAEQKADREWEDDLVNKIVDNAEIDIPQAMIDQEAEEMFNDFAQRLQYQGLKIEDYFKYVNTTKEAMIEQNKEQAARTVKVRLTLEAIFKTEDLKVEDKEIEAKMAEYAEAAGQDLDTVKKQLKQEQLTYFLNQILSDKLMAFIKENNSGAKKAACKKAAKEEPVKEEAPAKKPAAKKAPAKKAE